jgi:hypothetical protein
MLQGPQSVSAQTDDTGALRLSLLAGQYAQEISAPGYQTLKGNITLLPGNNLPMEIMLAPLKPPGEEQSLASQLRPGYTFLRGYAVDEQGQPVAGLRVRLKNAGVETITNERGYYSFSVLTPPETARGYPGTDTLIGEKPGYKTIVHEKIILAGEDSGGWAFDMQRGSGVIETNELPMSLRPTDEHQHPEYEQPSEPSPPKAHGNAKLSQSPPRIGTFPLPPNVIVGTSCPRDPCQSQDPHGYCYFSDCRQHQDGCAICPPRQNSECTDKKNLDLEFYVRNGLSYEWSSGWPLDSLEAGSVAYRTYGAWFVQHPGASGSSNYNIRSDECNQVFKIRQTPPPWDTTSAARATAGVGLSDDGTSAYKSEYALNTNNAPPTRTSPGCPDGYTGDGADWPCMHDPIAEGSFFAGHGRGMSQQGSRWWADGTSFLGDPTPPAGWQCILDHYYNDNGNSTGAGGQLTYRYSFIAGPGGDGQPAWDPRQKLIAYQMLPLGLAIINADGSGSTPLGFGAAPDWSQENVIVYQNLYGLYRVNPDGSGGLQINYDQNANNLFWSPDGTKVVYDTCTPPPYYCDTFQIAMMNADGTGQPIFLTSGSSNVEPAWSPDGRYIAFISDRGGSAEIYLMNSDGSGSPTQLTFSSPYPIAYPRWSQDGHYIVWLSLLDNASMLNIMDFPSGQNQYSYGPALAPG